MSAKYDQLIDDLNAQGFGITTLSDLYNNRFDYKRVVPAVIAYLDSEEDPKLLEEAVRALSVKWAKPLAAPKLAKLFGEVDGGSEFGLRWAIGNALAVVADDKVFEDVCRYLVDKSFGRSREMLALALVNMRNQATDDFLIALLDDEQLVGHALLAIKKRKVRKAYARVSLLTDHPIAWIRKEAEKTLNILAVS